MQADDIPVIDEADVVVTVGGSSGLIAATAAARAGARTVLLERFSYLGGCTTNNNTGIGWFSDVAGNQIIRGIPLEFLERRFQLPYISEIRFRSLAASSDDNSSILFWSLALLMVRI